MATIPHRVGTILLAVLSALYTHTVQACISETRVGLSWCL